MSLIVMISVALIQVILKKDVGKTHTIDFTRSLYTYAFLFTIPFILFTDFKTIPLEYYEVLFAGSIFNILAVVNLFRAIKYLGIGKAVPLSNLELVITLILSTLIFNETLSIIGIIVTPLYIFLAWWTHKRVKEFYRALDNGNYIEARNAILVPGILDAIFVGILPGLLLLLAYAQVPSRGPEPIKLQKAEEKENQSVEEVSQE